LDSRPNFVVIVADNLGYGDLGAYGNTDVSTPSIDALAARGTRFTSGYATAPVCAPSRVALLTGQYQQRFGFEFNTADEGVPGRGLRDGVPTLATGLRAAGYATGIVGKWHLGEDAEFRPLERTRSPARGEE
jgi:arylsulfatase A-like enzyme